MANKSFFPVDPNIIKSIPTNRTVTKTEAILIIQNDFHYQNDVTEQNYGERFKWSRRQVRKILDELNIGFTRVNDTKRYKKQKGKLCHKKSGHKTDIKLQKSGHINIIDIKGIGIKADIKSKKSGHKTDIKDVSTYCSKDIKKRESRKSGAPIPDQVFDLAASLVSSIERIHPPNKRQLKQPREARISAGAATIRLLIGDGYTLDEVRDTVLFGIEDAFWSAHIRSVSNLRAKRPGKATKFENIHAQYKRSSPAKLVKKKFILT